jgi:hypothetical protein
VVTISAVWRVLLQGRLLYMSKDQALRPDDFIPTERGRGLIELTDAVVWAGPEPGAEVSELTPIAGSFMRRRTD